MGYGLGGYGGGCGCGYNVSPIVEAPAAVAPISTGCGGGFTTAGVILVLFILLVIVARAFI